MRIAITGGTGFLGRHIVDALLKDGHELHLLVNKAAPPDHKNLTIVKGSLGDPDILETLISPCDVIIHCAGLTAAKNKTDFFTVNSEGTKNIANLSAKLGNKRFLLISSLAAREPQLSAYAASKYQAEQHLGALHDLDWDIMRPPAIYGAGDLHFLTIPESLKKGFAPRLGSDDVRVSLIHVQDMADAVASWVNAPTSTGQIYEIADMNEGGYSWQNVYNIIAPMVTKKKIKHFRVPAWIMFAIASISSTCTRLIGKSPFLTPDKIREALHENWVCDARAFQENFDWSAQINLKDGMQQTINWYKAHDYL